MAKRDTTEDFFDEPSDWGRYKHHIVRKYLRPFVFKLQSRYPVLAFVDACAGRGVYGDPSEGPKYEGSPIIAARCNEFLAPKGKKLIVYACEHDPEEFARLQENTREWTEADPPLAKLYECDFQEVLPDILEETRGYPTLIFIDPFEIVPVEPEALRPILEDQGRAPTELLLRIDPGVLARMTGFLRQKSDKTAKEKQLEESYRTRLIQMGISEEELIRYEDPDEIPAGSRPERLLADYLTVVEEAFTYVHTIPVREKYDGAPRYFLVHCTNSPHGLVRMNDVVSTTEDALYQDTEKAKAKGQGFLFTLERPIPSSESVKNEIVELLRIQREMKFVNLVAEMVLIHRNDLREHHYRSFIKELKSEGRVTYQPEGRINEYTLIKLGPSRLEGPQGIRPRSSRREGGRQPSGSSRRSV